MLGDCVECQECRIVYWDVWANVPEDSATKNNYDKPISSKTKCNQSVAKIVEGRLKNSWSVYGFSG